LTLGVSVVDLHTGKIWSNQSTTWDLLQFFVGAEESHQSSANKGRHMAEAWSRKREACAANKTPMGATCPGWVKYVGPREKGKYHLGHYAKREPQWSTMLGVVDDLIAGVGAPTICRKLDARGAQRLRQEAKRWEPSVIHNICRSRSLLGEYQPKRMERGRRVPNGKPITGYYPALLAEQKWLRLQRAINSRRRTNGPLGGPNAAKVPNLFVGLLTDDSGEPMRRSVTRRGACLVGVGRLTGRGGAGRFPYDPFERCFLGWVREVRLSPVVADTGKVAELEARAAQLDRFIEGAEADLDRHGPSETLTRKLRQWEVEQQTVGEQLVAERAMAAGPADMAGAPVAPTGEDRERVRALLRRSVTRIHCWVRGGTATRSCACAVEFRDGLWRVFALRVERRRRGDPEPAVLTAGSVGRVAATKRQAEVLVKRAFADLEKLAELRRSGLFDAIGRVNGELVEVATAEAGTVGLRK
jgi:hypothetical protein